MRTDRPHPAQMSEIEIRIIQVLGDPTYIKAPKLERYARLKREFPTESDAVMDDALKRTHEAGLWKKTFLADIFLTRKGKAWLERYRDELRPYLPLG